MPPINHTIEKWRPVPGINGYDISNQGRVRSLERTVKRRNGTTVTIPGKILKPTPNAKGYPCVSISQNGVSRTEYVHDLLLRAFVGEKPRGYQARHLDDVKSHCTLHNLRYGSRRQNQLDAIRNGRHAYASRTHCAAGHPYIRENVYRDPSRPRTRICRECRRASKQRYRNNIQETNV